MVSKFIFKVKLNPQVNAPRLLLSTVLSSFCKNEKRHEMVLYVAHVLYELIRELNH